MKPATLLVVLLALGAGVRAETDEGSAPLPHGVEWTFERVVVFKDGFSLVVKRGTGVSDETGRIVTEDVPDAAVLGTVWALPIEGRLLSMHAGFETTETTKTERVPVADFGGALRANVGKHGTVGLTNGEEHAGTIREVLATTFVLDHRMLPIAEVRSLSIEDMALDLEKVTKTERKAKRLTFRFEGGKAKREVRLLYFRPGIRWIPTYRVGLPGKDEGNRASISLQAEILNEAEDLVDVPFDLVVGVPNFRFRDVVSPMVLEQTLRRAVAAADPRSSRFLSNVYHTQVARQVDAAYPPPAADPGSSSDAPGDIRLPEEIRAAGTQDLFVYHLPAMSLSKGHRAAVPIFDATAPLTHVYTFEHHVRHEAGEMPGRARDESPLRISDQQVWHEIELTNETDVPWTTGSVLLMQGMQPLAQEMLTYTPRGGRTRLPTTVAVDLRARYSEEETGRQDAVLTWANRHYARVDMAGAVALTSHKAEAVDFEVVLRLGGRAEDASHAGEVTHRPFDYRDWHPWDWWRHRYGEGVNNHSDVRWRVRLEPGKSLNLTAAYHYFVWVR